MRCAVMRRLCHIHIHMHTPPPCTSLTTTPPPLPFSAYHSWMPLLYIVPS